MIRSVYRTLLWLHPREFRREFAAEMLWIFDESAATEGSLRLCGDGFASLVRQWVWRNGAWKLAIGALAAMAQLLLLSGLASLRGDGPRVRALPKTIEPADIAFSQGLLLIFVLLVGFIGFLGVLRARTASRH